MARFLSAAWFDELAQHVDPEEDGADRPGGGTQEGEGPVIEQVVTGTPDGDVRYQISMGPGRPRVLPRPVRAAQLTFTSDYLTAASIAKGDLSAQTALLEGRLRVSGRAGVLADSTDSLRLDLVPASVRATTTY